MGDARRRRQLFAREMNCSLDEADEFLRNWGSRKKDVPVLRMVPKEPEAKKLTGGKDEKPVRTRIGVR